MTTKNLLLILTALSSAVLIPAVGQAHLLSIDLDERERIEQTCVEEAKKIVGPPPSRDATVAEDREYQERIRPIIDQCRINFAEEESRRLEEAGRCGVGVGRGIFQDRNVYCPTSFSEHNHWLDQKADDENCADNLECKSNFCSSGTCRPIGEEVTQVKEEVGILRRLIDALKSFICTFPPFRGADFCSS